MGALAAAITLFLVTTPALAASPQVEAHVKVFQAVGADANRLKTFCEMMQIDEKMGEKEDPALKTLAVSDLFRVPHGEASRRAGCGKSARPVR
jgi:hypothetical protein